MSGSRDPHGDVLRGIDRPTLQALLTAYYRDLGWWVERAAGDARIDGGTWVLKRDRDVILLDVGHWGSGQRPQDAVASLVHDIGRAGATGAILVDDRAFSRADHDAANRHGHVRLIDAAGLREMLGDVPEQRGQADPLAPPLPVPQLSRARPRAVRPARKGNWVWWLIALGSLVVFVLLVRALLARTADTAVPPPEQGRATAEPSQAPMPHVGRDARVPQVDIDTVHVRAMRPPQHAGSGGEREAADADKRSEEAMRLIEATTPEM
jgi:Restriction endonuclease